MLLCRRREAAPAAVALYVLATRADKPEAALRHWTRAARIPIFLFMIPQPTTPAEIKSLLVTILADATQSAPERWQDLIEVELRPCPGAPHPNWGVAPQGNAEERTAICRAVCLVRDEFPRLGGS
jgi:hypothetical protein